MQKIILMIVYFVTIILRGNSLEKVNFKEELQNDINLPIESNKVIKDEKKEIVEETIIPQYYEIEEIPSTNVIQKQEETQEIIQEVQPQQEIETKETQVIQEESVVITNQFEENLTMEEQEKTEEYRYNNEMIQKMIDMINNNPNENMIQYGYNVVVDSSAKDMTNPFTYTDERFLIKIRNRCGTIHVYAEDYYLNGNYFGTDCYIY